MKRVLVVEDDHEVNTLICRYLEQRSFSCSAAASASDAIATWGDLSGLDLMLVDLELPDMDGAELCARLRAQPGGSEIPVLVMTGYNQEAHLERFRQVGVEDYMLKPFSPRDLLAKVRELTNDRPLEETRAI